MEFARLKAGQETSALPSCGSSREFEVCVSEFSEVLRKLVRWKRPARNEGHTRGFRSACVCQGGCPSRRLWVKLPGRRVSGQTGLLGGLKLTPLRYIEIHFANCCVRPLRTVASIATYARNTAPGLCGACPTIAATLRRHRFVASCGATHDGYRAVGYRASGVSCSCRLNRCVSPFQ